MPKDPSRAASWYTCARCGAHTNLSPREHHRQAHQAACTLRFAGEAHRVPVARGADARWRCPRCGAAFGGSSRRLQDHARKGMCGGGRLAEDDWETQEVLNKSGVGDDGGQDDAFDMDTETTDEVAALAASTGLQGEELARMVEWTTRKPERATRKTTVSAAIMALGTLMYPTTPEPPDDFDLDKPSHPPVELELEWSAPPRSAELTKPTKMSLEAKSKSSKVTRPQATANKPLIQLHQLQLPVQAELPPASSPARSKIPEAPFKSPLVLPDTVPRGVLEASCMPAVASPPRIFKSSCTPETLLPPVLAPSEDTLPPDTSPELAVPPDLQKFFATARIPLDHLAPIFVERGYVTAADLDTICEEPEFWEEMKADIVAKGKLVSWLAVRRCLTERAKLLGAAVWDRNTLFIYVLSLVGVTPPSPTRLFISECTPHANIGARSVFSSARPVSVIRTRRHRVALLGVLHPISHVLYSHLLPSPLFAKPHQAMDSPLDITVTSPRDWKYISEGGSSIVFSYVGPAHDSFGGTALRLRKALLSSPLDSPSLGIPSVDDPDDPAIAFQHEVVARVLPEEYLPRLEAVQVSRAWLEELAALAEAQRPAERRAKDAIDLQRTRAVLATDLVGGDVIAVEIKPKWGFLPSPTHLAPGTAPVKTTTCRFCMHAQVRGARAADADPAHAYCPLDLFADDPARVRAALAALWDAWVGSSGTANNLRVFVHGHMVRPDASPASIEALAAQLGLAEFTLYTVRDAFVARVLPLLRETSVLRLLARLQRTLDALDIEGLALLWARAGALRAPGVALQTQAPEDGAPDAAPLGAGLADPSIDEWKEFLEVYFAKHAQMDHDHPDAADLKYYCMAYLLSATFKDCSLILRIPEDGPGSITVIDLDVKPISRLAKWQQLDKEIVEGYKAAWKPRQCVESKY